MSGYSLYLQGNGAPKGKRNADGTQYATSEGKIWKYDKMGEGGMLYSTIAGRKVSWSDMYGKESLPVYTPPAANEDVPGGGISNDNTDSGAGNGGSTDSGAGNGDGTGGGASGPVPAVPIPGVQPSVPTYEQYLAGDGKEINDAYGQAIKNARQEYALKRATYGARGEQLGRAGLTGSGYGDYLEGAAYSAMQGAISQAELGRAKSYADYLTAQQQTAAASAASYAEYLSQVEDEKAQARSNYLSNTLVGLAMNNSALTAADIMQYAKDIGGYDISQAEAEKVLSDAALQRKVSGADAELVESVVSALCYDGDGNLLPMKTEEQVRNSYWFSSLTPEGQQSVLNKVQQIYGKTFAEGAAENAETAATQRAQTINSFVAGVCELVDGAGTITEETLGVYLNHAGLTPTDEELAKIKSDLGALGVRVMSKATLDAENAAALEAEAAATQNEANAQAKANMLEIYADYDDADTLRLHLQSAGYNDAAIDAAMDTYFELHANDISNAIDEAKSVGDLMSAYSLEQIQGMAGKTISKEQVSTVQAQVAARIEELLKQAYESGDASEVAALLGVTFDAGTTNFGGEIAKAAYDAYAIGILHPAQLGGLFDRFVEDSLADLGSESGVAVELAQIAGDLTDIIGDDEDLTAMYDGYMDRLAGMVEIGPDGRVYIDGERVSVGWYLKDRVANPAIPAGEVGDFCVHNGELYNYINIEAGKNGLPTKQGWVKVEKVNLKTEADDIEKLITELLIRKGSAPIDRDAAAAAKTYAEYMMQNQNPLNVSTPVELLKPSKPSAPLVGGTKSSYGGYLMGGK